MKKHLPSGWQEFTLEKILSKEKYSIKRGPFGSDLKKEFFVKNGIKVFEQYNPINNDPHWCRYRITKEKYNQLSAFKCKAGDFLISCSGTLGKIILLPNNVEEGIINQALLKIRLNNDIVDNIYFLNLFQSKVFQNKIYGDARGGAIKNVASIDEIKKIEFILPPIDEQKRIADILSTFDDLIENLTKLIEKKELYKKGVMQRVLSGEVRFNGFTDEWKTMRIGDICEYKNGNSFENYIDENGKLFLITLDSITIDGRLKNNHKKINIDTKELLSKNDIVMILSDIAHGYFLGLTAVIDKDNCYVLNQRVALLKPNNIIVNSYFLSKLININQKYFKKYGQGSSQQNLQKKSVENFIVKIPSLEEQNKIAELLTLIDKDIDNLKQILQLRKLQKKGVMQKLLTGEVRV